MSAYSDMNPDLASFDNLVMRASLKMRAIILIAFLQAKQKIELLRKYDETRR